jgi:hypothetical protein
MLFLGTTKYLDIILSWHNRRRTDADFQQLYSSKTALYGK